MKFTKITSVDPTGLLDEAWDTLARYSQAPISRYSDYPSREEEVISRAQDAEALLVSWNTPISRSTIQALPQLKYIGMCCSLYDEKSANVDIAAAREHNIVVKGIRDYGDEGLIEFILAELIRLAKGLGPQQWKSEPVELGGKKLGIIGLGATGRMLAERAQAFQMEVFYYSRNRKAEAESAGIQYRNLSDLLSEVEIISFHLPRNTQVMDIEALQTFGSGKILINTSLGFPFDSAAFWEWIKDKTNFAIFDKDGLDTSELDLSQYPNISYFDGVAGWTQEARERLSRKVIANVKEFLELS
ncbi:MAG: NAD(P)-dependent oxidoreductase [Bacteroidota bacterium]